MYSYSLSKDPSNTRHYSIADLEDNTDDSVGNVVSSI